MTVQEGSSARRSNSPAVYVVVLSWNGRNFLQTCLDSLRLQTYSERSIVVVDNGSTDDSQAFIRQHYPEVILIENACNLGFSAGNNVGMRFALQAGADYVVLLNQDTEVDPRWLEELVRVAEADPQIGAVASQMYLYTHKTLLNSTGIEMNYAGLAWDRGFGRVDEAERQWPTEVLGVTGGAMFLRAEALRRVGFFDSRYFAYCEDLDLSVRLWEGGYRLVYAPAARLYHRFSASLGDESSSKILLMQSNRWRFILKHFPVGQLLRHGPVLLTQERKFLVGLLRRGDFSHIWLRLRVYWRTAMGIPSILRYRWSQKERLRDTPPWWRFVIPDYGDPDTFVPRLDFRFIETAAEASTDRLFMGVNDTALGEGWYALVKSEAASPAFRWFGRAATCFLRVPHPGSYILQLHLAHPFAVLRAPRLQVFCDDREIGEVQVETYVGEWWTVHLPVEVEKETVAVRLVVGNPLLREEIGAHADLGLKVNEVSLLPVGSVLLRPNIGRRAGSQRGFAATSLNPSCLRAGISLKEGPRVEKGKVEFVLLVENQGDTLWLTSEVAGPKGYVVVGAQLFDRSDRLLGELGPRGKLSRPLFPGDQDEVWMRLQLPKGINGGRVKVDLVDERITWFEQAGSEPLLIGLP